MTNLNDFIEQLLGLPWDTRRDLFKIAEKNYEGETYTINKSMDISIGGILYR